MGMQHSLRNDPLSNPELAHERLRARCPNVSDPGPAHHPPSAIYDRRACQAEVGRTWPAPSAARMKQRTTNSRIRGTDVDIGTRVPTSSHDPGPRPAPTDWQGACTSMRVRSS